MCVKAEYVVTFPVFCHICQYKWQKIEFCISEQPLWDKILLLMVEVDRDHSLNSKEYFGGVILTAHLRRNI